VEVLIDGHCHTVAGADLDRAAFAQWCTEADRPPPAGVSYLDSQVGLAVRHWCPPVLDLPAHASVEDYLARRAALGWREATTRLLRAADLAALLVDTGIDAGPASLEPGLDGQPGGVGADTLGGLADAVVHEVVRLERIAEDVAASGVDAAGFADAYRTSLADRATRAVATKSILAYRYGLGVPPERPSTQEVRRAAGDWLRDDGRLHDDGRPRDDGGRLRDDGRLRGDGRPRDDGGRLRAGGWRLTDPVLLRFVLWAGVDTGLPLQLHTGFGDRDLPLSAADPALLQPFLAAVEPAGVPVVLLHCYPYHRQAGWLALVHPHVYVDVGLTMTHVGARAAAVLGEFCELVPFGKLLFSTDAYGLPELYLVGAAQYRQALRHLLDGWVRDDALSTVDAERVAELVCAGNAKRLYLL